MEKVISNFHRWELQEWRHNIYPAPKVLCHPEATGIIILQRNQEDFLNMIHDLALPKQLRMFPGNHHVGKSSRVGQFPGKVILYQTLCYFDNPVGIIESPGVVFPVAPYINTGFLMQHWKAAVRANSGMQKMLKLVQTTNICLPARVLLIRVTRSELPNFYFTQQSCCSHLVTLINYW